MSVIQVCSVLKVYWCMPLIAVTRAEGGLVYISNILLGKFSVVDAVLWIWLGKLGSIDLV